MARDPIEQAIELIRGGDDEAAIAVLECAVSDGDREVLGFLGQLLFNTGGLESQRQRGLTLMKQAVAQGSGVAAHNLATAMVVLAGESEDAHARDAFRQEAAVWLAKARELGCSLVSDSGSPG